MSRFQGIGTAYYGKTNYSGKSYVTTEWFVLLLFPIFPLKSLRVIKLSKQEKNYIIGSSSVVNYKILQRIPIKNNISQIVKTYLYTYVGLIIFVCSWFLPAINDSLVWVPILLMATLLILALIKSE